MRYSLSPAAIAALPEDDSLRLALAKAGRLASTPSSDVHELHAAAYDAATDGAFAAAAASGDLAKVVQIVLSLHGPTQRSKANSDRESYRGRTAASLRKGAETLQENLATVPGDAPGAKARRAVATSPAKAEVLAVPATTVAEAKAENAPRPKPRSRKAPVAK